MRLSPISVSVLTLAFMSVFSSPSRGVEDCNGSTGTVGDLCGSGGNPGGLGEGGGGEIGAGYEEYAWPSCTSSPRATLQCHPDSTGWFVGSTSPFYLYASDCCSDPKELFEIDSYYNNQYQGSFWRCLTQSECDAL
jgi:hypothetical protein